MEPIMASLMLFAGNFTVKGYLPCDGRLLSIAQNSALFSILGTQFGGDGVTTFALPNLPPLNAEGQGQVSVYIAVEGIYPSRASD